MIKKLLLILAVCSSPCWAVYAVISQVCTGSTDGGSNVTTSAINTTGANLIFLVNSILGAGTEGTITDNKSNAWTKLTRYSGFQSGVTIYYSTAPAVGSGHTFSEAAGLSTYETLCALAVSGATSTNLPFDLENGAIGQSVSSLQTGSITPSETSEIIVTGLGQCAGLASAPKSINSGFTIAADEVLVPGQHCGGSIAYKIKTDTTAENPTWSWTGTDDGSAAIAGFKDIAAGGTTPVCPSPFCGILQ